MRAFDKIRAKFILFFVLLIMAMLVFCGFRIYHLTDDELYKYQWGLHGTTNFIIEKSMLSTNHIYKEFNKEESDKLSYSSESYKMNSHNLGDNIVKEKKDLSVSFEKAYNLFSKINNKRDIVVAIIDSGIDIYHNELLDSIWINNDEIPNNGIDDDNNGYVDDVCGYNFYDDNNVVYTNEYEDVHGTHSAGIITARHNNGGIKGIAYDEHIKIMPIKILGENGTGKISSFIKAIQYAKNNGADICNISLGAYNYKENLEEIIKNSKMLFVVASGNGEDFKGYNIDENKVYPASFDFDNVITVANMSLDGNLYSSSNYGMSVDVAAPGTFVLSTLPENKYGYITGTSMAAPFVTAVCAMVMSSYNKIDISNIKTVIENSVDKINNLKGKIKTSGCINAYKAMQVASLY